MGPFVQPAFRARMRLPSRACGILALCALAAHADEAVVATDSDAALKPKWELGVAAAVGTEPDYPASDRYAVRPVGFPYFVYRGNIFRSDENGPRIQAPLHHDVELTVSGNASFGSHSDGGGPRAGMPKLDYLFELGPNLRITAMRPWDGASVRVELPVRAAFTLNGLHSAYEGLTFEPMLGLHVRDFLGSGWNGYTGIGPSAATGRFQRYFYEVGAEFARPDRPAYQAHGGYLGSRVEFGASRQLGRDFRLFIYTSVYDYAGAENEDSPLYKTRIGYIGLVGVGWTFARSKDLVQVPED